MFLSSIPMLVARFRRGVAARQRFVESHLAKGIASQIRATRDKLGWSQAELAEKVGMNQNAISRLESAEYGKPTITTLKRLAAAFDIGLIVRFVPFSEMVHWVSGTPYVNKGLSTESLAVPTFDMEEERKVFDSLLATQPQAVEQREDAAVAALKSPSQSAYVTSASAYSPFLVTYRGSAVLVNNPGLYLGNMPLRDLLSFGTQTEPRMAQVVEQREEFAHRDLKITNILIPGPKLPAGSIGSIQNMLPGKLKTHALGEH